MGLWIQQIEDEINAEADKLALAAAANLDTDTKVSFEIVPTYNLRMVIKHPNEEPKPIYSNTVHSFNIQPISEGITKWTDKQRSNLSKRIVKRAFKQYTKSYRASCKHCGTRTAIGYRIRALEYYLSGSENFKWYLNKSDIYAAPDPLERLLHPSLSKKLDKLLVQAANKQAEAAAKT